MATSKRDVHAMAEAMKKVPAQAGKQAGDQGETLKHYNPNRSELLGGWVSDHEKFDEVAAAMRSRVWNDDLRSLVTEYEQAYGNDRYRAWAAIAYPESMAADALSAMEAAGLQAAISPLHDKDRWQDGTPKKPHFHVLFYFHGKKAWKQVKDICDRLRFTAPVVVDSLPGYCRYLTHMDIDPEHVPGDGGKVRYDPADVVCLGGFDYKANTRATETDVAKAVTLFEEMCRDRAAAGEPFESYADFKDYLAENCPEYTYLACITQVSTQVSRYIHSATAARQRKAEALAAKREARDTRRKVADLEAEIARDHRLLVSAVRIMREDAK